MRAAGNEILTTKYLVSHAIVDINASNMLISRCCFAELPFEFAARAKRLFFLSRPIKFLIRGAVAAGLLVEAKAPPRRLRQITKVL